MGDRLTKDECGAKLATARAELARYKAPLEICAACDEQRMAHPVHWVDTYPPTRCDFEPSGTYADPEDLL